MILINNQIYLQLINFTECENSLEKFVCSICKSYIAADNPKKLNVETFQCKTCEKIFNSKSDLDAHNKTHSNEKQHICKICYKQFDTKYRLKSHQKTHTNEKKFVCKICPDNRRFKTKGQLKSHMGLHYDPKFSCPKCGKKFHTLSNTKQHLNRNIC